ncbi:hypothetical protein AYO38_06410 [bacterium SCGC AG-212-C10]|nr:hypothetical protein AYO38_06410 [bacterium SCGC AG-212-C10]
MTDDLGTISLRYSLKYERTSKHPVERLWQAITTASDVSAWMGYPVTVDLRLGGEYRMDFRATGGGQMQCVICRVEPNRTFAYVHGHSYCEWSLEPAADGCRYTFVQNGLVDRGEGEEELVAGWHGFFDQFDDYLDGMPLDLPKHQATWERLKTPYRQRLEALRSASTVA